MLSNISFIKIWTVLILIKALPFFYGWLYESFKKLPYPDFVDALTMLVFFPPVLIGKFMKVSWLTRSDLEPSTLGIIFSFCLWMIVDAALAYLILRGLKFFYH